MRIREPVVAGQFYPADKEQCRRDLRSLLSVPGGDGPDGRNVLGGLVPHAGWMCSGAVAAKVFRCLGNGPAPQVVVLFGGVHRSGGTAAAMFADGRWESPLGDVDIDGRLAERILGQTNLIQDDPFAHEAEHSIEVQIPFVAHLFPEARIVPIMVPPTDKAPEVGRAVAGTLRAYKYQAVIVGTTDLTHYGPGYGFTPRGVGPDGIAWAKNENDRRFIELVCAMEVDKVVGEAATHRSACSAGAVAATMSAVAAAGADRGILLEHTTSSDVLGSTSGARRDDSVGYAGIVFV